jgi:hypothetical protein
MIFAFICGIIGYFGIIRIQRKWFERGELTEGRFVLFRIPIWSLLVLIGTLMISTTFQGTMIGIGLSVLCSIIGYPMARWIYRRCFTPQ